MRFAILTIIIALGTGCASTPGPIDQALTLPVRDKLALQLNRPQNTRPIHVDGQPLRMSHDIITFYRERNYRPAWSHNLKPTRQAGAFVDLLNESDTHGLHPNYFRTAALEALLKRLARRDYDPNVPHTQEVSDFDLLMSDAFFLYIAHLSGNSPLRKTELGPWEHRRLDQDRVQILDDALGRRKLKAALKRHAVSHRGYEQLRKALERYRKIADKGGWPTIPPGPLLQEGDSGPRVRLLRQRLKVDGFSNKTSRDYFDEELTLAVRRFQKRYGLIDDGRVGPATRKTLNVSVEDRIAQIEVNLERQRWWKAAKDKRFIQINIPDYHLRAVKKGETKLTARVIVGLEDEDWQTPALSSRMTHMVINPKWNVPAGIFGKELLAKIQEDPEYLTENNMIVLPLRGPEVAIEPGTIDWAQIDPEESPVRIVQRQGPTNSLGRIKFIFPNPFAIYLHDTPAQNLFDLHERAFSHGCIRIQKPIDLADFLIENDSAWNHTDILAAIESEDNQAVRLKEAVPIHIVYWTAWGDENGNAFFRKDLYGQDKALLQVLQDY